MKYVKLPVYEFDELAEEIQDKIKYKERDFYWDYMWHDDLNLWLFDREDCPLIGSGVSIDSSSDLSIDVSYDRYDHCVFRDCDLDKNILIEKSGALETLNLRLKHIPVTVEDFIKNIYITWSLPYERDYFNSSGHVDIEWIEDWDDSITDNMDIIAEEISDILMGYMHDLQSRLMNYIRDLSWEAAKAEGDNPDPDMVYDAQGNSYTREDMEDDREE